MDSVRWYDQHAQDFFDSTINVEMGGLYSRFLKTMQPKAKILDAGCGAGRDTLFFSMQGYDVQAFDAAPILVELVRKHTGINVQVMRFEDLKCQDEFDGVWACASLLHFDKHELERALARLFAALKVGGVLYTSFKYGTEIYERDGRQFYPFNEESFIEVITAHMHVELDSIWITHDVRKERTDEKWLNCLVRRIE
ncbi:MAG: class I SAM-dependent methyltransferase [Oligoflexus sp.]